MRPVVMGSRALVRALLTGPVLLVTLVSPATAEELAPREYSLQPPQVLEAIDRGEGSQALAYYERTAAQAEQQGNPIRAARAWHATAMVALRLGRYQKSIQSASKVIEIFERSTGLSSADLMAWGSAYAQLGKAYRVVGDLSRSRQVIEEGLAFAHRRLSGPREGQVEGYLLSELATVAFAQRDFPAALAGSTQAARHFEQVERQLRPRAPERVRNNVNRWLSVSYLGIGRSQLALGHPDEADAAFDRGLRYARLSGLREVVTEILKGQGNSALARQDWSKALGVYQQSFALAGELQQSGSLPAIYHGLARAQAGLGRPQEALAASRQAVRSVEELRADLSDSGLRSGYVEDKQAIYQLAVRLALRAQHPDEALELAERSRARAFLDLLGSQTALSKGRTRALVDEEGRLRTRLAEVKAQAQDAEASGGAARVRELAEAAERDYRAFLQRVRRDSLEQASLMSVEPVTAAEIQGLLPDGTTLLEYLVGDNDVIVWVVDRHRLTVVRVPGDRQSLVTDVRRYREAIDRRAPLADVQSRAERLYRRLLEPARHAIAGDRLVIVPHDVLHYVVPFNALRSPAGRWTVEEFALSTLPSASVLRFLTDKSAGAPERALVVGNPDLGPSLALPWAEREAQVVGQQQSGATVLVKADATEAQVKKLIEGVGLAHFATHGEFNESDPLSSALLLVGGDGEDGRLEVRELFGLDLHARLVVLSACETGLGKLSRGDELVGLQRAFLYAGTPAVVTTLWKVDDRASFELIRAFYARLGTAGAIEALRQAQLETAQKFPHPVAWAAFGLTGIVR